MEKLHMEYINFLTQNSKNSKIRFRCAQVEYLRKLENIMKIVLADKTTVLKF